MPRKIIKLKFSKTKFEEMVSNLLPKLFLLEKHNWRIVYLNCIGEEVEQLVDNFITLADGDLLIIGEPLPVKNHVPITIFEDFEEIDNRLFLKNRKKSTICHVRNIDNEVYSSVKLTGVIEVTRKDLKFNLIV